MQFSEKIVLLMRKNGLTTRSLGAAVGVSNGTVAGWTKGALPRPEVATKLAQHFGLPVEVLLDDARELPTQPLTAEQREARRQVGAEIAHDYVRQYFLENPETVAQAIETLRQYSAQAQSALEGMAAQLAKFQRLEAALRQMSAQNALPSRDLSRRGAGPKSAPGGKE